jgi:hypothetical protein
LAVHLLCEHQRNRRHENRAQTFPQTRCLHDFSFRFRSVSVAQRDIDRQSEMLVTPATSNLRSNGWYTVEIPESIVNDFRNVFILKVV